MKKCVYTVVTGNYDTLKEPLHPNWNWDFVCFTDNPLLTSERWKIVLLENPDNLSDHLLSRRPKILTHKYLPDYSVTLYIDASFHIIDDINDMIDNPKAEIGLTIRSLKRGIENELNDLKKHKTIDSTCADQLITFFDEVGYDYKDKGIYYMGGIIYRRHTARINRMMDEWWKSLNTLFYRDQPFLQYLLKKYKVAPTEFSARHLSRYLKHNFHNQKHIPDQEYDPNVYYFTPADPLKQIGKVYNAHCAAVPDNDDWICIRDGDTMFLTSNWSEIIKETIKRYPDTSLFGCYTNRIGLDYQLTEHGFSENPSVLHHAEIARERWEKYGTECVEIDKPVAGMFMLFKRSVWTRVPFKDELVIDGNKFFDWDFGERVIKLGGKVRLMKGLVIFHYYRFHTGRKDKSHLLS